MQMRSKDGMKMGIMGMMPTQMAQILAQMDDMRGGPMGGMMGNMMGGPVGGMMCGDLLKVSAAF
eukprot:1778010-Heterocapsa_arctica.AAC.1